MKDKSLFANREKTREKRRVDHCEQCAQTSLRPDERDRKSVQNKRLGYQSLGV